MPACAAYKCTQRTKTGTVSLHRFPKNPDLRQKWIAALRRENYVPSGRAVLCSRHFREEDMDRTSVSTVRIRENAVPYFFPTHSEEVKILPKQSSLPPVVISEDMGPTAHVNSGAQTPRCTPRQAFLLDNLFLAIRQSSPLAGHSAVSFDDQHCCRNISVNSEHCYSQFSPTPKETNLEKKLAIVRQKLVASRKKMKVLLQAKRRLAAKNDSLKNIITEISKQNFIGEDALEKSAERHNICGRMGWAGKEKEYSCFMCGNGWKGERGLLLLREETALSRVCLGEKLQEVVGTTSVMDDVVLLVSPRDRACWHCATALNTVDRLEHRLDQLREDIVETLLKTRTYKHKIPQSAFKSENVVPPSQKTKENKPMKGVKAFTKTTASKEQQKLKSDSKVYPCRFCSNVYGNEPALLSHMLVKHPPKYLCHICDSSFSNETRYKGHLALHLGPPPKACKPPCTACGVDHDPSCSLRSLTCATCRKERYVESDFPNDKLGSFQCKECALAPLEQESEKKQIILTETKPLHLMTEPASSETAVNDDAVSRKNSSQEIAHFKCNDCGDEFEFFELPMHKCFLESQGEANKKKRESHGEGSKRSRRCQGAGSVDGVKTTVAVKCRTCDKEFESVGSLREHWRSSGHPWEVDTQCDVVNNIIDKTNNTQKTFKVVKQKFQMRAVNMDCDANILEKEDNDEVRAMFIRVDNKTEPVARPPPRPQPDLKKEQHDTNRIEPLVATNSEVVQNPNIANFYQCNKCDLRCSSKTTLLVHSKCHDKSVACSVCSRWLRDSRLLAVHRRKAHRGHRPYQCIRCPRAFSVPAALRLHLTTSHRTTDRHHL